MDQQSILGILCARQDTHLTSQGSVHTLMHIWHNLAQSTYWHVFRKLEETGEPWGTHTGRGCKTLNLEPWKCYPLYCHTQLQSIFLQGPVGSNRHAGSTEFTPSLGSVCITHGTHAAPYPCQFLLEPLPWRKAQVPSSACDGQPSTAPPPEHPAQNRYLLLPFAWFGFNHEICTKRTLMKAHSCHFTNIWTEMFSFLKDVLKL